VNSWFSADVISLCKLGFRHVGAHARREIVINGSDPAFLMNSKYEVSLFKDHLLIGRTFVTAVVI